MLSAQVQGFVDSMGCLIHYSISYGVDIWEKGSPCSRLRLTRETYLVRKGVCSKFPQSKLKTTVLAVTEGYLDSNRSIRRRSWIGTRHDSRRALSC